MRPFSTLPILGGLLGLLVTTEARLSAPEAAASAKAFEVTASRFEFHPDRIEVVRGDRVQITLHSSDTTHGLALPEFKVKIAIPKGGASVTAEFVAAKAGTFRFKCSEYCGPGHKKMLGTLVVAEKVQ